jgi:hypothetical protein
MLTSVVVGLPLLFRSLSNQSGTLLFRDVAKQALGLSALVGFYVNFFPMPLLVEVLLQIAIIMFLLLSIGAQGAERSPGQRLVSGCAPVVLGIVGLVVIVWSTVQFVTRWPSLDQREVLQTFGLTIWLPMALFPFLYLFALFAAVEVVLVQVSARNDNVRLIEKLGLWVGFKFSLRAVKMFNGRALTLPPPRDFRSAADHVRDTAARHDDRRVAARDQADTLLALAGVSGMDAGGAQIDRREFHATKEALRWLHTCQSGWYERQGDTFWGAERVDGALQASTQQLLPRSHGIVCQTTPDHRLWRAWRVLPNGWVLGVGATDRSSMFLYSGPSIPVSWPGSGSPWIDAVRETWPVDWDRSDVPIT